MLGFRVTSDKMNDVHLNIDMAQAWDNLVWLNLNFVGICKFRRQINLLAVLLYWMAEKVPTHLT